MNNTEKYWVLVPAAGIGKRMGGELPKQYLPIAGYSVLEWTLKKLDQLANIQNIVLVLNPRDKYWQTLQHDSYKTLLTVSGGDERCDSVLNGLQALKDVAQPNDWVLVHDAVRPCVALKDIEALIAACGDEAGGLLATPVKDTLKKSRADNSVEKTLDRQQHWLASTPQMFRYGLLCEAMENARVNNIEITDEASAMEAMGHQVKLVEGRSDNIKLTQPADLPLVEFLLKNAEAKYAV